MRPCTPRFSNSLSIGFNVSNPSGVINATDIKTHPTIQTIFYSRWHIAPLPHFAISSEDVAKLR